MDVRVLLAIERAISKLKSHEDQKRVIQWINEKLSLGPIEPPEPLVKNQDSRKKAGVTVEHASTGNGAYVPPSMPSPSSADPVSSSHDS